ncbi:ABC-type transport system substrate-binding protein [Arthrobacter sp. V4I6]|uniref:ABC transporter substrate-binding protein n=1 Tax=unclassified Arthrobacter TaxID=235627 RepID=UPI002784FC29|nr:MULTISPECIES: ABC transporter substrate-binding protein [unclassified Arthrobacter]MDQ0819484.1 ABC-type transport system substrate-binding protein [Arthrobacter sp. V1I7]MDQ0853666.1 ABC-type transport system substrate-binding protein [Arthrobacter sp. V4I6]
MRRKPLFLLIPALASALALSGCAGPAQSTSTKAGILRIGAAAEVQTLDPHFTQLPSANSITHLVFEGLFTLNAENKVVPELADSHEYSPDGLTLTVKIKSGHKFSNGDPVDAAAVAASFSRLLDPATKSPYLGLFSTIKEVTAVNENTVAIKLASANGHMLSLLANNNALIVNVKAAKELGAEFGRKPVGSGPYVVSDYVGGERYSVKPSPVYVGDRKASLTSIEWVVAPEDASRMALLETGDVDIVERVPPESVSTLKSLADTTVEQLPSMFSINIELNLAQQGIDNPKVRQALNLAVDRNSMISGILGGLAEPSITMPGPGTQDELRKTFEPIGYDPERAKELLKEAGYGEGELTVDLRCPRGRYIKDEQVCQALKSSFEKVGVKATAQVMDLGAFLQHIALPLDQRNESGAMVGRATQGMDYTLYRLFHSGISTNITGYNNPEVDKLLEQGRATSDTAKQKEIYGQVQEMVWNDQPDIFLWYQKQTVARSNAVGGFQIRGDETMLLDVASVK